MYAVEVFFWLWNHLVQREVGVLVKCTTWELSASGLQMLCLENLWSLRFKCLFKQLITLIIARSFILRSKISTSLGKKQAVFGIRFPPRKRQVYISVPISLNITYFSRKQYSVSGKKKTMMRMGYSPKLKEKTSYFSIINLLQICISCRRID